MSLPDDILACRLCPLADRQEEGAQHVPATVGAGYRPGGIAVMSDAPNFWEAKAGEHLAGREGALFDELAGEAGLERRDLVLLSTVRCRPPGNRLRDYPEAVSNCAVWTEREMAAYQPKVIVLMGAETIKTVFGTEATVARSRGQFTATPAKHPWGWHPVTATYRPTAAQLQGGAFSEIGRHIVADLRQAKDRAELMKDVIV